MLAYLRISDFALIRKLELEFPAGLTVLSGETGAGKSIILAAVELLLGQRARGDLIRAGAREAVVEAQFMPAPGGALERHLEQAGLEADPDGLVVRRVVSSQGRNRVQVAGTLSTLALLNELGPEMLSVCGQNDHQVLLRPEEHLLTLDAYAQLDGDRERVGQAVAAVMELDRRQRGLRKELAEREARRDLLTHTVEELEEAGLDPEEEQALLSERRVLANAEQIARLGQEAYQGLYAVEEGSVLEGLGRARGLLEDLGRLDPGRKPLAERLQESFYQLEEVARELRDYLGGLNFEPGRLDWIEARLLKIQRLARKHGGDLAAALATLEEARAELASLETGDASLAELGRRRDQALEKALELAGALGQKRRQAGQALARAVEAELADLGMPDCRFEVRFSPPPAPSLATGRGELGPRGLESAEFHIAPNPGEGFKPLARIASGGELSRLLLTLRGLVARRQGAATQVFDEVDAGIGGATGFAVGRRLAGLAREAQVLCITHLPQIAAFADRHFTVKKRTHEGRTETVVEPLDPEGQVEELARMLTGPGQSHTARQHAQELMAQARSAKQALSH